MTAAVTGMGAVTAFGRGCDALENGLARGRDGIRPVDRFDVSAFSVQIAALVPGSGDAGTDRERCVAFAIDAAREALAQTGCDASRAALVLGTSLGDDEAGLHAITEAVAAGIAVAGPRLTVTTACSSATNALGIACNLLGSGDVDLVIAGGADALSRKTFAGFHALGVLSQDKCAPFGDRIGTTLGEGAGFLALEPLDRAVARGATVYATVLGHGTSADAFHETSPDPGGRGIARAVAGAVAHAGLTPADIDYVNAHGTGTAMNDVAEWRGLQRALGPRAEELPVSSSKSFLGHAQGAAGILEVIATILCIRRDTIPPTMHVERRRQHGPPDPVAGDRPRAARVRAAVCTNSAFGGSNAAVVVGHAAAGHAAPARERRSVRIAGAAVIAPPRRLGRVPPFDIDDIVPTADPRGVDPATCYLVAAAARALCDGDIAPRGSARERAGLIVATTHLSATSSAAFHRSIDDRGIARVSATAFARMVMNAPAGGCSRLLGLKGPTCTLTTGHGGGLVAVATAAEHLASHHDADVLVAGGFDELHDDEDPNRRCEGAACVALRADGPGLAVAGWALAGPCDCDAAVARALAAAGLARADRVWSADDDPRSDALAGALALTDAVEALRRNEVRTALVTSSSPSASCAVVITGDAT